MKQIEKISSIRELEAALKEDSEKPSMLRYCGFVDMSNEIIERLASLKQAQDQARKKEREQDKRQREKHVHKMEEEKRSRQSNDPRTNKKSELASASSTAMAIEEPAATTVAPQRVQKRVTTQMKQQLISDVAKVIHGTFPAIQLQDCLVYGTSIVERSMIENSQQTAGTTE